ncbi:ankyrin repeat domain-containing protein [Candidatus Cardinium hertigii]|uniref:ankyrin repeat domain-containing protein n=1 Tax=Candidatus Cardinium hertigii TaxID=247481 RepID=UPI003D7CD107
MHKKQISYIKPFNLLALLCRVVLFFLFPLYGYANRYPSTKNNDDALHIAVFKNYVEIVKVLLSVHGININLETNQGKSALDLARENNHLACVGLLEKTLKKQS